MRRRPGPLQAVAALTLAAHAALIAAAWRGPEAPKRPAPARVTMRLVAAPAAPAPQPAAAPVAKARRAPAKAPAAERIVGVALPALSRALPETRWMQPAPAPTPVAWMGA